ncbi:dUTP diphosphatase [Rosettibacter firmus]|uniref:dUTP diphosphatase n=1 Tax=Rosettibacter firmus TaxID=3111522 RepID=UPI00336BBF47
MIKGIKPQNIISLLKEYDRINKTIKDKWIIIGTWLSIISLVIIISFVLFEISKLGSFGKILLPLLLVILIWEINLLSKNYFDKKLFIILSALLDKDENLDRKEFNLTKIDLKVKRISDNFKDIPLPEYATDGSSGLDIRAAIDNELIIQSGSFALIPTNLKVEIPEGYEIQVRPRSGLAAKHGIGLLNSPGTIDSDYRGEIKIILFNFGNEDFVVRRGDRIAQLVLSKIYKAELIESEEINESKRNEGGFGHTGLN